MARTPAVQPELPNTKPKKTRTRKPAPEAPTEAPAAKTSAPEALKRARKPKTQAPADSRASWEYKFVAFGDLHVSAKTLDRCIDVLRRVGELAQANEAFVVCLGDFWHQRAALNVRQLDAVLTVFAEWKAMGLHVFMIPGNHDQVSLDGAVHAVRVFEPFENVTIVTEPMVWEEQRIAFLPWREREGEQDGLLTQLEGDAWTVFTHAEIEGATNNQAHAAKGRVSLARLAEKTRATYAGHYHKRQQLGDRSWYIGSPFEMDFGERDMPHGVALITGETIVPEFFDFDDMPKHVRIDWSDADAAERASAARPNDIVELHAPHDSLRSPSLLHAVSQMKATDIRFVPAKEIESETSIPSIALTVENAIEVWANEVHKGDGRVPELIKRARDVLAEVADSRTIVPFAPKARICQVDIENFCAIRGLVSWDVRNLGPVLLQGPMGAGKTSICDAITWGLFGTTTPRKATGGSLKADDVVHDASDAAEVTVTLALAMPEGERFVVVTRTKKRGKGAVIRISGMDEAEGIADQQAFIHRLVGMDVDLWRACVYLGQGEVENFVVSADKRRKDLLARAFGLSACEGAVKAARARTKALDVERQKAQIAVTSNQAAIDALAGVDFSAQARMWEEQMAAKRDGYANVVTAETAKIAQLDPHLASEPQWASSKAQYEAHLDSLTKALASSSSEAQIRQTMAQLGSYTTELANVKKKLAEAEAHFAHVASKSSAPACHHCNQPIDPERYAIQLYEAEQSVIHLRPQVQHFDAHIANMNVKLGELHAGGDAGRTEMQSQIAQAREAISKCNEALTTLAKMRENKNEAERLIKSAQHEALALASAVNPFAAKAQETEEKLVAHRHACADAEQALDSLMHDVWYSEQIEEMFNTKGLPVLVLRTVLHELETQANRFLASLFAGKLHCRLSMREEDLDIEWFEWSPAQNAHVERSFLQLSGGQRRCAELAFSPFALSEMIFNRCGIRVPFLVVDELTTHLDSDTKPIVCDLLREIDRETIIVIDHDIGVRGEFDTAIEVRQDGETTRIEKVEVAG